MQSYNIYFFYTRFRLKQISRFLYQLGIIPAILIFVIILYIYYVISKFSIDYWFFPVLVYAFIIYLYQSKRKDKSFLLMYLKKSYRLYFFEYALISVLFVAISLLYYQFVSIIFYIVIAAIAPLLFNFKITLPSIRSSFLKKGSYQYNVMLRKNVIVFVLCYLIATLGVYNHNEKILYFFSFIFSFICISSVIQPENSYYIRIYKSGRYMIYSRVVAAVCNFCLLFLPFIIIGIQHIYIVLSICFLAILSLITFTLLQSIYNHNFILVYIYGVLLSIIFIPLCVISPLAILAFISIDCFLTYLAINKFNKLLNDNNRCFE